MLSHLAHTHTLKQWTACVYIVYKPQVGADVLLWPPVCLGKGLDIALEVVMSSTDQPLCSSQPAEIGLVYYGQSGMSIGPTHVVSECPCK